MSPEQAADRMEPEPDVQAATAEEARLIQCISMAMGCISPLSKNNDERLAWYRLLDAMEGRWPRDALARDERSNLADDGYPLPIDQWGDPTLPPSERETP